MVPAAWWRVLIALHRCARGQQAVARVVKAALVTGLVTVAGREVWLTIENASGQLQACVVRDNGRWVPCDAEIEKSALEEVQRNPPDRRADGGQGPGFFAERAYLLGDDPFAVWAAANRRLPGVTDVVLHGDEDSFGYYDGDQLIFVHPYTLAQWIKAKGITGPIRLLSCTVGLRPDGAAQQLANAYGAPVLAADKDVWAPAGEDAYAGDPRSGWGLLRWLGLSSWGTWKWFVPQEGPAPNRTDPPPP
jgi:hypothetical protein